MMLNEDEDVYPQDEDLYTEGENEFLKVEEML